MQVSDVAVQRRIVQAAQQPGTSNSVATKALNALVAQMGMASQPQPPPIAPTQPSQPSASAQGSSSAEPMSTQAKLQALLAAAQRPLPDAALLVPPPAPSGDAGAAILRRLQAAATAPAVSPVISTAPAPPAAPPQPPARAPPQPPAHAPPNFLPSNNHQAARTALRQACSRLLQSDDIVDMLLNELSKAGFEHSPS